MDGSLVSMEDDEKVRDKVNNHDGIVDLTFDPECVTMAIRTETISVVIWWFQRSSKIKSWFGKGWFFSWQTQQRATVSIPFQILI